MRSNRYGYDPGQDVSEVSPLVSQRGGGEKQTGKTGPKPFHYAAFTAHAINSAGADETLEFDGPNSGYYWLVDRITVVGGGECDFYINAVDNGNLVDNAQTATKNIGDMSQPIYVPGGNKFIGRFTGLALNTDCFIRIQVRVYRDE